MRTKISIIFIFILILSFGCNEDFLNRPPLDSITIDNFYETTEQIEAATALLYGWPWFTANDKAHWTIGDGGGGNDWTNDGQMAQFFTFSVTTNNAHLNEAWVSFWMTIAHANAVINEVPEKAAASVPRAVVTRAVAEAKFIRATAYFYLVRLWGGVPIIENNTEIVFDSKIPRNRVEDVYKLIILDLEQAIAGLPNIPTQPGRVSSWSAKGMLAKVYLAYSGYNESGSRRQADLNKAAELAGDVINNSGLALMTNYEDLFRIENDNNQESLFAWQWIACTGSWGTQNTNQAYLAPSGDLTGAGDGWGGWKGPTIDLQSEYSAGDRRRKPTYMLDGDFYPELKRAEGGYTHRIGNGGAPTLSHVKKYVIGSSDDNGDNSVCFMSTGQNTYIQRLADVYLIYAEAVLGNNASTSDAGALTAFNAIRNRAGLPSMASFTWEDIRRERRIEFAYEADYWYDLVRWHYYKPQEAVNHVSNQERGSYWYDEDAGEHRINSTKFQISSANFTLPIPQSDSDSNPLLLQDPVPYDFEGR
jgi:starch-binding outer membrane protein, SusD/RagB family